MAAVELTESFLAKIGGWEAIKQARALLNAGRVLSSNWTPPVLKGVVQEGSNSLRAGLVIKDSINIENLCSCRQSRDWGTICAHSIAVGLRVIAKSTEASEPEPASPKPLSKTQSPAAVAKSMTSVQFAAEGQTGEKLELAIIFPPNLEQALQRGRVMVCFEARTSRGRHPLANLSTTTTYAPSSQDRALFQKVVDLADGQLPAMLQLDADQLASLLPFLANHPEVTLGRNQTLQVDSNPWPLSITAKLEPDGQLCLQREIPTPVVGLVGLNATACWGYAQATFKPVAVPTQWRSVLQGPVRVSRIQVPLFLSSDWPVLVANGMRATNFQLEDFSVEAMSPRFSLHLLGGLAQMALQLHATYGARIIPLGSSSPGSDPWMPDPSDIHRYWTRNPQAEQQAIARLVRYGFAGPDSKGLWNLRGENAVLSFLAREFPRLKCEWDVTLEERLEQSCATKLERIEPQFAFTSSGVQWMDFSVNYRLAGGEVLSPAEIQRLILSGQGHGRLRNGKIAVFDQELLEDFEEALRDCNPTQQPGGRMRIEARQAGYLESTARQHGWTVSAPTNIQERFRAQSGQVIGECPSLGDLDSVLRPYQKQGVAWFSFLRDNQFGGVLADEMGLGKTLQTLAFLRWTRSQEQDRLPNLVICPSSLIFNWVKEAEKFTPSLKTIALHGADRHELWSQARSADLLITSYGLARRDAEQYASLEFDTVVLDEAQHIKNRQTQNAQAVKAISSRRRLVLTGTPLENSLLDLWSIFDFLMPGYLGAAQDFRERYELPIARDSDAGALSRLSRRLRPFILRRLKKEVATELPPKLEHVAYCELVDGQRVLYQQLLEAGRREMLETAEGESGGRARMAMLTTLLRLRQVCCDPRLVDAEGRTAALGSGKTELFMELLEEALDGGHRVLVFSQFTSMLALLKQALEEREMDYCYLDGSTANRGEVVQRFQSGSAPVFLISLKAGGVGLNLTAADTVIHFDPWWNPAVEDQASSRAHRIGQSRVVTSYKLIARDTVEEKILLLQQRKRELTAGALSEEGFASTLTWEEMCGLFS
ncbi:MAG: hypothetical protein FJ405_03075 [Verrucomicrobia bacterium]|nr:hypothetical protein [Verrucomicrobiota bacterium]